MAESEVKVEREHEFPQGCLSLDFDEDMDQLLSKYKQVYILAPAKGAGTTFESFQRECMKTTKTTVGNILSKKEEMESVFQNHLELPSLLASHAMTKDMMCDLMQHATKDSLIIYSHREETDRLLSAIKHVLASRLCFGDFGKEDRVSGAVKIVNKTECHVRQSVLIEVIKKLPAEMHIGSTQLLTCGVYDCIRENRPNLVFMNYKQAGELQKLLTKHHCPKIMQEVQSNMGSDRTPVLIVLEGTDNEVDTLVPVKDWLKAKAQLLELVFRVKRTASCQGTTREIEDGLFTCSNQALLISGQSFQDYTRPFPF